MLQMGQKGPNGPEWAKKKGLNKVFLLQIKKKKKSKK